MIAVIMEKEFRDASLWTGRLGELRTDPPSYIDLSSDEPKEWQAGCKELLARIRSLPARQSIANGTAAGGVGADAAAAVSMAKRGSRPSILQRLSLALSLTTTHDIVPPPFSHPSNAIEMTTNPIATLGSLEEGRESKISVTSQL